MAAQPQSRCHNNCGSGAYMPKGKARVKGFMGAKGNRHDCMRCGKAHIFDDNGKFLGFAE